MAIKNIPFVRVFKIRVLSTGCGVAGKVYLRAGRAEKKIKVYFRAGGAEEKFEGVFPRRRRGEKILRCTFAPEARRKI